jgi:predicted HTH domain antitoxin
MNATMTLEVPLEILESARMTMEEIRLELAIALFRLDRLSMGKAAEFACLPVGTFQDHLATRQIGPHYGVEDALEDAKALAALMR